MTNLFGVAADDRGALCYFSYSVGGGMRQFSGFSYQVSRMDDGRIEILINEDFPDRKRIITSDPTVFTELQAIIDEHNMTSYKGNYERSFQTLDAGSWHFDLRYEYGFSVSATGITRYPRGGAAAFKALREYFKKWEEIPGEVDSIVSFNYTCGKEKKDRISYNVSSDDTGVTMHLVNETYEFDEKFKPNLSIFEKIRKCLTVYNMDTPDAHTYYNKKEPGQWSFNVKYASGEALSLKGSYGDFKGGFIDALESIFQDWIPVTGKMTRFRFDWQPDYHGRVCYYVNASTEPPTIYFHKGSGYEYSTPMPMGAEDLARLRQFVAAMKVDNTYEDSTPEEGKGHWYLTINFDSGDILGINGRISNPRTEEEMKICDPIHNFFKPIIAKLEQQMKEQEALLKETVSTENEKDDSGRNREQSSKSATRKWWQFWK
jgi:hypothetical protein